MLQMLDIAIHFAQFHAETVRSSPTTYNRSSRRSFGWLMSNFHAEEI
jgi:hypothetical protein